jgi:autotransporter-associated beta strand protein
VAAADTTGSTIGSLVFNLPAGTTASLQDDGTSSNGFARIVGTAGPGLAPTTFADPGTALTVNTAGGSSLVKLATMDAGFAPTSERFTGQAGDTFRLVNANAVPSATSLTLTTAALDLHGLSPTIGSLNGSGTVTNTSSLTVSTLTVHGGAFGGSLQDGSGTTALTVAGDFTLGGASTYSGTTTINAGAVLRAGGVNAFSAAAAPRSTTTWFWAVPATRSPPAAA